MNVNDKFFWDEVMNGINEKFTDEAAELMSHKTRGSSKKEEDDEYSGFLGPTMKISLTPEEQHPKRRIAGGIFAGAAVAAAVAVAVGISAGRNNEELTSESSSGTLSEVNLTNSGTSETDDVHSVSLDAKIDTDINSYKLDFELYEKYFHGVWENDIYVGYSHAALPDRLKISLDAITHIGFKQADGGCYMGIFSDAYEQFFFVSGIDRSIMRSGQFDKDSGEHYLSELDENIRRTGDFEDKGTALNLMGMLKLCGEYGVDPEVITDCGILTGKDGRKYALSEDKRPGFVLNDMRFNGERENESGQKQLCFSAKWQDISKTYKEYFMAFCITKTDDGWSAPEFCADYAPKDDDTPICPDGLIKADGVDYDMIEKVLAGCWKVPGESYGINILYTKTASNDDAEVVWKSCYEDESGWYFLIESSEERVYFIPRSDPDALYYYLDKDGTKSSYMLAMRRYYNATADTLELSGDLSYTGEQRLLDVMGDDFKDAFLESSFPYHLEDKSAPNQYFNGLSYVYNGDGVHAIIVSEDVVELATRFARDERAGSNEECFALVTLSDCEQLLWWSFVR